MQCQNVAIEETVSKLQALLPLKEAVAHNGVSSRGLKARLNLLLSPNQTVWPYIKRNKCCFSVEFSEFGGDISPNRKWTSCSVRHYPSV